jgi:hypothetical protein
MTRQLEIMNQKQMSMRATIESLEIQLDTALGEVLRHPFAVRFSLSSSLPEISSGALLENLLRDDVAAFLSIPNEWVEVFNNDKEMLAHVLVGPPEPLSLKTNGKKLAEDLVHRLRDPRSGGGVGGGGGNLGRHIARATLEGPVSANLTRNLRALLSTARDRLAAAERDGKARLLAEGHQLREEAKQLQSALEIQQHAFRQLRAELVQERAERDARVAAAVAEERRALDDDARRGFELRERARAVSRPPQAPSYEPPFPTNPHPLKTTKGRKSPLKPSAAPPPHHRADTRHSPIQPATPFQQLLLDNRIRIVLMQ